MSTWQPNGSEARVLECFRRALIEHHLTFVERWVLGVVQSHLSPAHKAVAVALAEFADQETGEHASLAEAGLASALHVSRSRVNALMGDLRDGGWCSRSRPNTDQHTLTLPAGRG